MSDVFISYAREDRDLAAKLAARLRKAGYSVFWDRNIRAGTSFSQVLEQELTAAGCILVLWSRYSIDSGWVQDEATAARDRKVLLPILIQENVSPPLGFRHLQTATLIGWDGEAECPDVLSLLSDIDMLVGPAARREQPVVSKIEQPKAISSWRISNRKLLAALAALIVLGIGSTLVFRFHWRGENQVQTSPFTLSFTFIFVVLLAFFSIPLMRLSLLRSSQRLRRWDGAWLTASTYFTASLLTFGLLTLVYYRFEAGQGIDRRLAEIAKEVEDNAGAEFRYQRNILERVLRAAKSCQRDGKSWKKNECPEHPGDGKLADFIVPENDDRNKVGARLSYFDPTLDLVSFTGQDGMQVAKWTMKPGMPANLIPVKDRGFFRAVDEGRMWIYSPNPEDTPKNLAPVAEFFLDPLLSRTTAENVVVQSILPKPDPEIVLSITSRPASLFGVFMQPGFGFTIIDRNGDILFHSQQSRNLRENLFDDCMDPSEIRSAASGRSMRIADVNYLGRDHRFLMRPLRSFAGSPWTLITFYDREHLRSIMAGMITVTLALFFGYTLLTVVGLVMLVTLGIVRNVSVSGFSNPIVLLWPDEETHGNYRGLIAWFATLLIVEAIALASLPPLALTCLVAVMPLIAVALAPAWLRFFNWQSTPWVRHLPLRRRYTLAAALLLIMTTVVPCTAFFRTAFDYEMGLVARHEMAALMGHLRAIKSNTEAERRSDAYLKSLELHEKDADRRAGLSDEYLRSRIESSIRLGVYSCAAFVPKKGMVLAHQAERVAECPFPARYAWMRMVGHPATSLAAWPAPVKRWFPGLYDSHAEDRFGAAHSVDPRMDWTPSVNGLKLASRDDYLPELRVEPLFLMPSWWAVAGFMAMVGLISAWMFFLNSSVGLVGEE